MTLFPRPAPPIGELRWSPFFRSWIIVVQHSSDEEWRFVVVDNPSEVLRARARLSELPLEPEAAEK